MTRYRSLDPTLDWSFFVSDNLMSMAARDAIHPLTQDAAIALWETCIATEQAETHPMLLTATDWITTTLAAADWEDELHDHEHNAATSQVAQSLCQHLGLAHDANVFFIASARHAYELPFAVFVAHWPCFLMLYAEGALLFHPESKQFAQFNPHGKLCLGPTHPKPQ